MSKVISHPDVLENQFVLDKPWIVVNLKCLPQFELFQSVFLQCFVMLPSMSYELSPRRS